MTSSREDSLSWKDVADELSVITNKDLFTLRFTVVDLDMFCVQSAEYRAETCECLGFPGLDSLAWEIY